MSIDDFRAQFAQAAGIEAEEAPAEVADTAVEDAVVETPAEIAEPEVGEAEVEEEVPAEEDDQGVAAYLEKYNGDVDKALKAAVEAQRIIGRQGAEVGELRKVAEQVNELRELVAAQQAPVEEPGLNYDASALDEYFAENPHQLPAIAQQAIDASDGFLYQKTLAAWTEQDPVGAMDFHARAVSRADMAKLREEMAPALQSVEATRTTNEFAAAFEAQAARHDDFAQVMNSITDESIAGFPKSVLGALQAGDQASKQEVLETLYRWTKAEQAGNLTQAATAVVRKQEQDSRAARQDAAVASSSTSQNREAKSGVDAFHEQFQASDAFRKAAGLT